MVTDRHSALHAWEGRDVSDWARECLVGDVYFFDAVSSTNDVLAQLAAEGAKDFTVVVADAQSQGRGRGGSAWSAAPASSLLFSVLFRTHASGSAPGCAPIRIGLSVVNAIPGARVKWPNDVVIPGHGKVAGILCEGVFGSHIIAGVGVNVLQSGEDFPPDLRGRACSVRSATDAPIGRADLLSTILGAMRTVRYRITDELTEEEAAAFDQLHILRGCEVVCEGGNGKSTRGVARGVAPDGALCVDTADGPTRVYNGSVRLADDNSYPGTR